MSEDLPEGWASARIADVFEVNPRKPAADHVREGMPVSFVPMSAVDAERGVITTPEERPFGAVRKGYTAFADGDVLLAKITPCFENGKAAVATSLRNGLGFGSSEFHVFRPQGAVLAPYLFHFLRQPQLRADAAEFMTGTAGQARVPIDRLSALELPIAPLVEQRRIVARVESLLEQVRRARDRLDRVPLILERFRQAVLAAACSGRLTEAWRLLAKPPVVSPLEAAIGTDGQDNTDCFVEDTPESWAWTAIDDACEAVIDYRGRTPPTSDSGQIPHVRTSNIRRGRIDWNTESFVTDAVYQQYMTRGIPESGDVIFTMEAPLGDAAPVDTDRKFSLAQRLLLLRGRRGLLHGPFLALILQSPQVRRSIEVRATGSTVLGIAYKRLKYVRLPIPSVEEQVEIVRRVDGLFAFAAAIEQGVERAAMRAARLPQAILSKAFAGELVPTEADLAQAECRNYETAEQLIERVRQAARDSSMATLRRKRASRA